MPKKKHTHTEEVKSRSRRKARSFDLVINHVIYRPNWTPLSPIIITYCYHYYIIITTKSEKV